MAVIVKCSLDAKYKKITYVNRLSLNIHNLNLKLQQAFSLASDSFSVVYVDDDGIHTRLQTDNDLDECLEYFGGDCDDNITLNLEILVDYDGPSLSDAATSIYNSSSSSESVSYGVKDADNCSISLSQSSSEKSTKKSFSLRSSLSKLSVKYKEQAMKMASKQPKSLASSSNHNTKIDSISDTMTQRQPEVHNERDEDGDVDDDYESASQATHNPLKPSESTPSLNTSTELSNKLVIADGSNNGPDRGDLAVRWFADQSERALLATFGTQLAPSESTATDTLTATSDDYQSNFDSESVSLALERDGKGSYRYTLTGSNDGIFINNDVPLCSSCGKLLDNLRYICTTCGVSSCEYCPDCIEGAGAVHAIENTPKHAFRECVRSDQGWIEVDYGDERDCSICKTQLEVNFKCVSCQSLNLCRRCWSSVGDIHPSHAFLELPQTVVGRQTRQAERESATERRSQAAGAAASNGSLAATSTPQHNRKHQNVFCHHCLGDIIGPRFHCAVCALYDLCQNCESLGAADGNGHDETHVMMKIPLPLSLHEVQQVSARARHMWNSDRNGTPTIQTENTQLRGMESGVVTHNFTPTNHHTRCNGCNTNITGERYACLHCSGEYNLCSECENMSYVLHDSLHIFLKLDYQLREPGLRGMGGSIPVLYHLPAGKTVDGSDTHTGPNEYLSTIRHDKVVCDRCMEPVMGKWFRCVNLAGSYDLCSSCEPSDSHKGEHIYLVMKSIVDMDLFADFAEIGSDSGKALLPGLAYAS
ncbi:hypothetical protein E3P91_03199 [Wallemia ichthyophaga]|nr:hypothetical protein E3P91_03199 [Wallemia ichthyophaga]TIB60610.1 hypothetical protein E3P78_03101 [Wallemia ichthyophaga]